MDNIKVAVRCRPFNKRELDLGTTQAISINDNQIILGNSNSNSNKDGRNKTNKSFTFDFCFDSSSTDKPNYASQKIVYDQLGVDILNNAMTGYNACIFAYGQTGSGKSFTMMGSTGENKGLIPRLCEGLFDRINSNNSETLNFKVEVSYMEIYNEKVRDLIYPSCIKQNLKVREHRLLGAYVDGLTQLAVSSYKDIEDVINEGNKSRTVAATNMNSESSRSHAVFCLKVSQNIIDHESGISGEKLSRLSLVDLAGSEKVSKTGVEGERLKECSNINRSLLTLGLVISSLADNTSTQSSTKAKPKHIPYRDSVLTWLLKDSLGGNSKTVMVFTVSPALDNYEETLSTLRYAERAKQIVNNAVVNEDPNAKIIRTLREELDMLKKELTKAKEQINAEALTDRLKESEKLYLEISKPWDEKLADTVKIQQQWSEALQTMGISVESSGIKVEKDKYYLVNLNADPSMNELLVYYLKDLTLVGRCDAKNKQDIQLMGVGICEEHCAFYLKNNHVCVAPIKEAKTWVNGKLIHGETFLNHGDRIALGMNHFFRLNCPTADSDNKVTMKNSYSSDSNDFKKAQEEILLQNKLNASMIESYEIQNQQQLEDDSEINEDKSVSSTFSTNSNSIDENGLALELAIQKFEQDYSNVKYTEYEHNVLSSSSSTSSIGKSLSAHKSNHKASSIINDSKFRKGLQLLREKLLRANSLVREGNSLCKEMNKPLRFRTTLQIPAFNLTPDRKKDSLLSEPAIIVKIKEEKLNNKIKQTANNKIIIDFESYENYILQLRDIYSERLKNNSDIKDENNEENEKLPNILLHNQSFYFNLIGVANLFLDVILFEASIPFEYNVRIISQQGEIAGRLKVRLELLLSSPCNETNADESSNLDSSFGSQVKTVKFRFNIVEAFDLPANLNNYVFCQYKFFSQNTPTIVRSCDESNGTNKKVNHSNCVKFNHETEFEVEVNEEFNEYCLDSALSIEIYSHRHKISKNGGDMMSPYDQISQICFTGNTHDNEKMEELDKLAKFQSLVESWSEVSKSFELNVKILELNNEGYWSPVDVKQHHLNQTGGIYQLKQGQSRQISVSINQTKPDSIMYHNGTLFNYDSHKIDKISVGCVYGVMIGLNSPLDSYQEIDLNKLRSKCRKILESRKSYLHEQIKSLYESEKPEDQERRDLLSKQLIDLGEEIVEVDAPKENSGLPGSTMEWSPQPGMEEHVPVIFFDLNGEEDSSASCQQDNESTFADSNKDREYYKKLLSCNRLINSYGNECYLRSEQETSKFIDLKLIRWNDSSLIEVVDNEINENDYHDDTNISSDDDNTGAFSLRALARWDSSIHQSLYLNQATPLDRHVYLTIKVNVKFKKLNPSSQPSHLLSNQYIDVVLRKRICVNIYLPSSVGTTSKLLNLNRFKNLIGSSINNLNHISNGVINVGGIQNRKNKSQMATGITYRIITSIPKILTEIENRESLAIKAAACISDEITLDTNNSFTSERKKVDFNQFVDNSLSYFERYAKTIQAVDNILKQDKLQQKLHIEKIIAFVQKNGYLPTEEDYEFSNSSSNEVNLFKKTLSVPNLIKNGLIESVRNLTVYTSPTQKHQSKSSSKSKSTSPQNESKMNESLANESIQEVNCQNQLENANMPDNNQNSNQIKANEDSKSSQVSKTSQEISELYKTVNKDKLNEEKKKNIDDDLISKQIEASIIQDIFGQEDLGPKNEQNLNSSINNESVTSSTLSLNKCESFKSESELNRVQSNASISSSISQQQKKEQRMQLVKQQLAELPEWIKENAHVIVSTSTQIMNKPGFIRYIGATKFAVGVWIGVELEDACGKNDGSYNGVRYFSCEQNKGVFVRKDKLTLFINKLDE